MGYIHEYAWHILAVTFLSVPLLIAYFSSPLEEALKPLEGTYRIVPHLYKNALTIEIFEKNAWIGVRDELGRFQEFQTEFQAEEAITKHIKMKKEVEEQIAIGKYRRKMYLKDHPVREVPPFKFTSGS